MGKLDIEIVMKTCVFITGTNAVGKTTLAKRLIKQFGGIKEASKELTLCNDTRVCFAGKYADNKMFGGVDGFNQTKCLESVVRKGLSIADVIFCEGVYLHTFGLNLLNAMFVADKHLIVFLYSPVNVINERLLSRAGKGINNDAVWKKQQNCATAAKKWQSIGVPVLCFDTSRTNAEEVAETIIQKLKLQ